jgi:hypothetical protein
VGKSKALQDNQSSEDFYPMHQHLEFSSERERVHTEFKAIFKTCAAILEQIIGLGIE